jgi:uncharacterized membrane protein
MAQDWGLLPAWESVVFDPLFISVMIALWVALVVVAIHSLMEGGERPGVHLRTAREILDERRAKGEIGRDEYADRRKAFDYVTAIG